MTTGSMLPNIDTLWDYDNPAVTAERFRQLLPEAISFPAYHAELLTQLARTHGLQREFEAAHRLLDETQLLLTGDNQRAYIRYLLERGRTFNASGQPDQAHPLFLGAFEAAQQAGEQFLAVDAAHMMAIIEPPEQQLAWNFKALELAEGSNDERARKWCGSLYNNIGWSYHDRQDYETALSYFQKALRFRESQGDPELVRVAKWCLARVLRSLGRVAEALATQQALLVEYDQLGEEAGYVNEELGECLLLLDRLGEARPYFNRAYTILSNDIWLQAEQSDRLERLKRLGEEQNQD